METNKKSSLIYVACAAILLTLLGAFSMFVALSTDFTPSLGYFSTGSIKAALLYITLAAGVALGIFAWIFLRRVRLSDSMLPTPVYTKIVSVLLMAALLWHTGDDLVGIFRRGNTIAYWGLVLLCDLFALLFIVSLLCNMGADDVRRGPLSAFSSFFPPLYTAGQLFLLYLDETVAVNGHMKIIYQLMYISFMLLFTAQTGLLLGRKTIFPRYIFCMVCAVVLGGTISISALLCAITGIQGHNLLPSQILLCFAVTAYALCQLISASSASVRWTEAVKKEA
ncbi:MAG: hypothetical protein KHW59_02245 [Clostridiales bacterium]|nr:hypothetical protein [Clostridiales bacterium]